MGYSKTIPLEIERVPILVPRELIELRAHVRSINETLTDRSVCYYCGESSAGEDHVIPHSLLHKQGTGRQGWEIDTLPACRECNGLLSSLVFDTLAERKEHLSHKLRKRYAKEVKHTPWTESELAELGEGMRAYSIGLNLAHSCIMQRLTTLEARTPLIDRVPVCPVAPPVLTPRALFKLRIKHKAKRKPIAIVEPTDPAYRLRERVPINDPSRWVQDASGQWDFVLYR